MDYQELVQVYHQLESTTKRLEKTFYVSELLKKTKPKDLKTIVLLIQGKAFPSSDSSDLGIAVKLVSKAISVASGETKEGVERAWKNTGDLGLAAQQLIGKKSQATLFTEHITTDKVLSNLQKLATIEGAGSVDRKIQLIAELLTSASSQEAKYIVKTILSQMRTGVGEGSIRDAIMWANFGKEINLQFSKEDTSIDMNDREEYNDYIDAVQYAYDLKNDFGEVAYIAATKGRQGLRSVTLDIGTPIKVMLALKAKNVSDGIEQVGSPSEVEYKYDGFRVQVHKQGDRIDLFTRRLENVTTQFPDIVSAVKQHVTGDNYILDGEAVGYDPKNKKYLPFQNISQRIKRKYDITKIAKEFPVELNVFDVLAYNGENLLQVPRAQRREKLNSIITPKALTIVPAKHIITESEQEIERFYQQALQDGNEGVMLKALDAPYKPGGRVGYMVKLKPTMDTLDLVIVGAEWGEGKRSAWLSSFVVACRDDDGEYKIVGRVSTGLKEKDEEGLSFNNMTDVLKPIITKENGKEVEVESKVVIEVDYEEIQQSPTYDSGFALRFPRVKGLREDRLPQDCSPLSLIEQYYEDQRQ